MNERISREELVKIYQIEVSFFDELEENGLLKTESEGNIKYLKYEQLSVFERFMNWHYDLDVNIPGLEVIHHLLSQIENLKDENRKLLKNFHGISDIWEDFN